MSKQQKKTYTCSLSGRVYKTRRGALNSEERERRKDYIRLHTETPQHFAALLVEKGKEFWGWDVEVSIEKHEVCKESFWTDEQDLGVKVMLNMRLDCNRRVGKSRWLTDYLRGHINGLGRYDRSWHEVRYAKISTVMETLWLPFSEFPLLSANYDKYSEQQKMTYKWLDEKSKVNEEGKYFAASREEYKELDLKLRELYKLRDELDSKRDKLMSYFKDGYVSLWECQNPAPHKDKYLFDAFDRY